MALTSTGGGRLTFFLLLGLLTRDEEDRVEGLDEGLEPLGPLEAPPEEAPFDDPLVGAIWCMRKSGKLTRLGSDRTKRMKFSRRGKVYRVTTG